MLANSDVGAGLQLQLQWVDSQPGRFALVRGSRRVKGSRPKKNQLSYTFPNYLKSTYN